MPPHCWPHYWLNGPLIIERLFHDATAMLKKIKIGTKITLILLLVVVVSVVSISYIAYQLNKKTIEKRYAESFKIIGDLKADQLERYFASVKNNLLFISSTAQIRATLQEYSQVVGKEQRDEFYYRTYQVLSKDLGSKQDIYGYSAILLTDPQGIVLFRTDASEGFIVGQLSRRIMRHVAEAKEAEEVFFGVPFQAEGTAEVKMFALGKVINPDEGNLLGFVIFQIDVTKDIYPIVSDTTGLGNTGEMLLCRQEGNSVEIISPLRNSESELFTQVVVLGDHDNVAVQYSATAAPGGYGTDTDYRGEATLAYWQHIPAIRWGLVTKMDQDEIDEPIRALVGGFIQSGIIIMLLATFVSFTFSRSLTTSVRVLKSKLALISKGILPENIEVESKDEIGEITQATKEIVLALKRTANFAHQIGQGDYDAEFRPMSNEDILGNALLTMRDSIQTAESKDKERNWIVTGVAEVGQILRSHNDLEALGEEMVQFTVEKIHAIQGAFYVVEEEHEEPFIILKSSYAYRKKKYLKARFRFAEGLVGQAAVEQDTILRTEIPDDYMSITSGILGDQKPTCLLIVPLITNEKVYGILEYAGFQTFTQREIDFIQEISVIVARTIFNITVNDRTIRLLRESQKMSEELKSQQEILRSNAEIMAATQEELRRTNTRLEEQVQEVSRTQKRMQLLLENASEIITIYEKDGTVRYISPSVEPILGYAPEEVIGIQDTSNVHPESIALFKSFFEELLSLPFARKTIQYEYKKKDGLTVWLEATGANLMSDPAIQGLLVNSRDITERRRAEREERMRSQMQALSENSPDLITRLNHEGIIFYINPVIWDLTGKESDYFVGKGIQEAPLHPDIQAAWLGILAEISGKKEKIAFEMEFPTQSEEMLVMQVNAIPELNDQRQLESVLIVSHDITERKKTEIEIQNSNRKITESINYAKRIQTAILPDTGVIRNVFKDSFIFYKPRDVVSGDFPWFMPKGDNIFIAAVDCTGHGVPGALISLIGYFILNDVVNTLGVTEAGAVLDELNTGVTRTLRQDADGSSTRDGMDIALCKINLKERYLEYAGANRPLFYFSEGELHQVRGDSFPIGGGKYKTRTNFTTHRLELKPGDEIYMFSDGLPDQFGGPENKKFAPRRIRELITYSGHQNMTEMANIFEREFAEWKGERMQTDDVLMIGIKF